MNVRVVISGRNYDAASRIPNELSLADGSSVDDAIRTISQMLPEGTSLPPSCLVAVSGKHLGTLASHSQRELTDGDELVFIAPVAGG